MLGTPAYMAPEQIAAEPVSAGTDVYALGEIYYEMIAGRRVFVGDQMQILRAKLVGDLPPLELPKTWSAGTKIVAITHAALQLDPKTRPSLAELAAAVTDILASQSGAGVSSMPLAPVPAPGADGVANTQTPYNMVSMVAPAPTVPRSKAPIVIVVVGLLIAAGVFTWLWLSSGEPTPEPKPPVVALPQATQPPAPPRQRSPRRLKRQPQQQQKRHDIVGRARCAYLSRRNLWVPRSTTFHLENASGILPSSFASEIGPQKRRSAS